MGQRKNSAGLAFHQPMIVIGHENQGAVLSVLQRVRETCPSLRQREGKRLFVQCARRNVKVHLVHRGGMLEGGKLKRINLYEKSAEFARCLKLLSSFQW